MLGYRFENGFRFYRVLGYKKFSDWGYGFKMVLIFRSYTDFQSGIKPVLTRCYNISQHIRIRLFCNNKILIIFFSRVGIQYTIWKYLLELYQNNLTEYTTLAFEFWFWYGWDFILRTRLVYEKVKISIMWFVSIFTIIYTYKSYLKYYDST